MAQVLTTFIQDIEKARKELNKVEGSQLQSQKRRDDLRLLVERYFSEVRSFVVSEQEQNETIKQIDDDMQELLAQCHKRGLVKRYQQMLKDVKIHLIALDTQVVSSAALDSDSQKLDAVDVQIINTLKAIVPSASLSYHQAIVDLQIDSKLSWRGPATDLREALREALDHLAPDDDVKAMPGYKQDPEIVGPTMKQKVRFLMKSRGASRAIATPAEAAANSIEAAIGTFVRSVYTRSSVSTHTPTDKLEVLRVRDLVRVVLCELLEILVHR